MKRRCLKVVVGQKNISSIKEENGAEIDELNNENGESLLPSAQEVKLDEEDEKNDKDEKNDREEKSDKDEKSGKDENSGKDEISGKEEKSGKDKKANEEENSDKDEKSGKDEKSDRSSRKDKAEKYGRNSLDQRAGQEAGTDVSPDTSESRTESGNHSRPRTSHIARRPSAQLVSAKHRFPMVCKLLCRQNSLIFRINLHLHFLICLLTFVVVRL